MARKHFRRLGVPGILDSRTRPRQFNLFCPSAGFRSLRDLSDRYFVSKNPSALLLRRGEILVPFAGLLPVFVVNVFLFGKPVCPSADFHSLRELSDRNFLSNSPPPPLFCSKIAPHRTAVSTKTLRIEALHRKGSGILCCI